MRQTVKTERAMLALFSAARMAVDFAGIFAAKKGYSPHCTQIGRASCRERV